ncbi:MAG: 50S ribosomal protein L29 [Bdellovibrionales bacterium]|nr:50S ribosomal protein L29 [Bdellovibrionales bacterium]
MKKTKEFMKELKGLSDDGLKTRGREMAEELMKLRFQAVGGQVEQPHRIGILRKELARVHTVLSSRRNESKGTQQSKA